MGNKTVLTGRKELPAACYTKKPVNISGFTGSFPPEICIRSDEAVAV
jgi:hypothetical protein